MQGYLNKRGKRIGSRVRRYMRLEDCVLSNHHAITSPPTWRISIKDATITCSLKKRRLTLEVYNARLELFADTPQECQQWYEALTTAKTHAALQATSRSSFIQTKQLNLEEDEYQQKQQQLQDKENHHMVQIDSDVSEARATHRLTDLSLNFKVIKPTLSGSYSENSEDEQQLQNALYANFSESNSSQVYEETPASMIFKQFNFPSTNTK